MSALTVKRTLFDTAQMARMMRRMAAEVVERAGGTDSLLLVGVRTRGVPLADFVAAEIKRTEGVAVPVGVLDITLYRDDLSTIAPQPVVKESVMPVPIDDRIVVLCDDVLYSGRTIRAAMDALIMDYGRPRAIRLAVLIDRGHRELPIHADCVGEHVQTTDSEVIKVSYAATDGGKEMVELLEREGVSEAVWQRGDLLGVAELSQAEILHVLDTAESFVEVAARPIKKVPTLRGKTVINLFFEASTRTSSSFEIAEKRLSADNINFSTSSSSLSKGETLLDTAPQPGGDGAGSRRHPACPPAGAARTGGAARFGSDQRRRRRPRASHAGAARRLHDPPAGRVGWRA